MSCSIAFWYIIWHFEPSICTTKQICGYRHHPPSWIRNCLTWVIFQKAKIFQHMWIKELADIWNMVFGSLAFLYPCSGYLYLQCLDADFAGYSPCHCCLIATLPSSRAPCWARWQDSCNRNPIRPILCDPSQSSQPPPQRRQPRVTHTAHATRAYNRLFDRYGDGHTHINHLTLRELGTKVGVASAKWDTESLQAKRTRGQWRWPSTLTCQWRSQRWIYPLGDQ